MSSISSSKMSRSKFGGRSLPNLSRYSGWIRGARVARVGLLDLSAWFLAGAWLVAHSLSLSWYAAIVACPAWSCGSLVSTSGMEVLVNPLMPACPACGRPWSSLPAIGLGVSSSATSLIPNSLLVALSASTRRRSVLRTFLALRAANASAATRNGGAPILVHAARVDKAGPWLPTPAGGAPAGAADMTTNCIRFPGWCCRNPSTCCVVGARLARFSLECPLAMFCSAKPA